MTIDSAAFGAGKDTTDDIWEAMFTQRAIRYWQDKPVPRELLEKIIQAASKAPSGSNLQPWIFVVVDSEEQRNAVGGALKSVYDGSVPLQVHCRSRSRHSRSCTCFTSTRTN